MFCCYLYFSFPVTVCVCVCGVGGGYRWVCVFLKHWRVRFTDFKHEAGLETVWAPAWLEEGLHAVRGGRSRKWAEAVGCGLRGPGLAVWGVR